MSIYYSPFRLINSPFLFANNSRAEEGEEGRKKERKRRRKKKKKNEKMNCDLNLADNYTPLVVVARFTSASLL